jgi:hypothetical protein
MALTSEQLATLAADIAADSAFDNLPHNSDGAWAIAEAYNQPASPDWYVWKISVTTDETIDAMVWSEFLSLTVAQRQTLLDGILANHDFNPSLPNIRQGIAACLPVGSADGCRNALLAICSELATRAEKLFSSGGQGTAASPSTRAFVGSLAYQEVERAMGW